MKSRKAGSRHPLLFYRRTMDRLWKITLLLGLFMLAVWGWTIYRPSSVLSSSGVWMLGGAIAALALTAFAFFARYMAYVQAHAQYLKVVTPFLRMNVSYRRFRSVYPVLVQQLFPPKDSKRSQQNFLEPFYGKTAVVVDLRGYPLNPTLLKLFLPSQMFSPRTTGLVFVVSDWMGFSTELDSLQGSWLQQRQTSSRMPSSDDWTYQ